MSEAEQKLRDVMAEAEERTETHNQQETIRITESGISVTVKDCIIYLFVAH